MKKTMFIFPFLVVIVLNNCTLQPEITTISINLGGSARYVKTNREELRYELNFYGPNDQQISRTAVWGENITVSVTPGTWTIIVDAFLDKTKCASSGNVVKEIIAGKTNQVRILMNWEEGFGEGGYEIIISIEQLQSYLQTAREAGTMDDPVVLNMGMQLTTANWLGILEVLEEGDKFVELILSECTRSDDTGDLYGMRVDGTFDPDSSTSTGKEKIVSIILPEDAESIVDGLQGPRGLEITSFDYFFNLKHINTGNGLKIIGKHAFKGIGLLDVIIGNKVTVIGSNAFYGNQLTLVAIPNNVTIIEDNAFAYNQLENVSISNNVTSIGGGAFSNNKLKNIIIPDKLSIIESSVFLRNELAEVSMPESITIIGADAFGYNQLTAVTIPSRVTEIGLGAFGNNQLTEIILPAGIKILSGFNSNKLTNVNIPNGVTEIGYYAFAFNNLVNVSIPDSVTFIGDSAFVKNQIEQVKLSSNITSIGVWMFAKNLLTSVEIPDNVSEIGQEAFMDNPLTSVTIGDGVTLIWHPFGYDFEQAYAYNGLRGGTYTLNDENSSWTWTWNNPVNNEIIHEIETYLNTQPGGNDISDPVSLSLNYSLTATNWNSILIAIENAGKYIELELSLCTRSRGIAGGGMYQDGTFDPNSDVETGKDKIVSITLPETADSIKNGSWESPTFYYFKNLKHLNTGNGIRIIDHHSFSCDLYENTQNAVRLTSITFGNNVTTIGVGAFENNQLAGVIILDNVESIGSAAFTSNQLTGVVLGDNLLFIGNWAFSGNQIDNIQLGKSIETIEWGAFSQNKITTLTIPDSVNHIGYSAFTSNPLTSVTIGENVMLGGSDLDAFENDLDSFYNSNSQQAGTYTWDSSNWNWVP